MRGKLAGGLLALGLIGCGGGSTSGTTVQGTVQGKGFGQPSAVFRVASGPTRDHVLVLISDDPNACDHLVAIPGDAKSTVLGTRSGVGCDTNHRLPSLFLSLNEDVPGVGSDRAVGDSMDADFDPGQGSNLTCVAGGGTDGGSGAATDGGTTTSGADAGISIPGTGTSPLVKPNSGGGHMFKSAATGSASDDAEGDFDLVFPNNDHLKGTFKAKPCNALQGGCTTADGLALAPALLVAALLRRRRRS